MARTINLSRLMRVSWEIQERKHKTRSAALTAAWTLFSCEDIAVEHLTHKLNRQKDVPQRVLNQYTLFKQ